MRNMGRFVRRCKYWLNCDCLRVDDKRFSGGTIWIILQLYEVLPSKLPANPEPLYWIAIARQGRDLLLAPTFLLIHLMYTLRATY
ncbi:hypothetical protein MY11210_008315 [Beauveria gryllotalpidicola]